ncbi:LAMI_0H06964g1_1 [Lachancea mirantina]|uniref:Asparagine--tRNA ligase, mitochondrial n=1 Tax=Lachancea mirantina TaxID=1230905 RepID=A0A1G4KFK8_9SACH|nr:LAMI_0H06964g1_1 [Lachancea mirantina]
MHGPLTVKNLLRYAKSPSATVKEVQGWIKSVRILKKMAFIDLSDGTSSQTLKIVVPRQDGTILKQLRTGQSLKIAEAIWKPTPTREQPFELEAKADDLKILGSVPENYPLQKKYHTLAFLRTLPTLKHRSNYLGALLRFRSIVENSLSEFFTSRDFTKTNPPILTAADCEGAGELFSVNAQSSKGNSDVNSYFGKSTYLTVSGQLHLEVLALALGRCWSLIPCFRAEESDTNRHLSEFWMLEAEISFVDDVRVLTSLVEDGIKHVVQSCLAQKTSIFPTIVPQEGAESPEMAIKLWEDIVNKSWPVLTYTEAISLLEKQHDSIQKFTFPPQWGQALQSEHEKWLASYFNAPVFVIDYPRDCKAFYMKQNSDGKTVACFDLVVPKMGEIVGGSIREDNYELLVQEMERRNMNMPSMEWYLSLRQNGSAPHGGFGLGLERLVAWLFGAQNVRDGVPFYRSANGSIEL